MQKELYSYLSFFNLREPPFSLVPSPSFFFPAKAHLESIEVLAFSLNQGSLISVLTGEPGLGKTQVVLTLISKLSEEIKPLYIFNPALKPEEFFKALFKELGLAEISHTLTKDEVLKKLKDFLKENPSSKKYILVIDEAQLLPDETLEELRLITNLNEGNEIKFQILLSGQTSLSERLKKPEHAPLRQRISVWEILRPLEKEEILSYLWFRIKQVSDNPELILEKKIEKTLYKWTKGVPRLINKLMDRSLFIAYVRRDKTIRKKYLKEAKKTFLDGLLEA
jgi:general secretion pathway protein A